MDATPPTLDYETRPTQKSSWKVAAYVALPLVGFCLPILGGCIGYNSGDKDGVLLLGLVMPIAIEIVFLVYRSTRWMGICLFTGSALCISLALIGIYGS